MKELPNYISLFLLASLLVFGSCSKDADDNTLPNEANLDLATIMKNTVNQANAANSSSGSDDDNQDDDDYGDDCIEEFECFDFVFPITAIQTDGTEVSLADDDAFFEFLEAQEENYEPNFVFPLSILIDEEETQELNSLEELEEAFDACFDEFECFELIFPVTLIDAEGAQVVINTEEELFSFLDAQDEEYEIEVVYPIEVTIDGETVVINDDDEIEEIYEECDDDWDDVMCFDFIYPIQMTEEGEVITIEDEDTLFDYIEGLTEGEDVDFVYPFDVVLEDGTTMTLNDLTQVMSLFESCE